MAAVLLIPFLSLRFGVLSMLDNSALGGRPLPPFRGPESLPTGSISFQRRPAAGPFFASVHTAPAPSSGGGALYAFACSFSSPLGRALSFPSSSLSVIGFAAPPGERGVRHKGVYRISRNPMRVSYFSSF